MQKMSWALLLPLLLACSSSSPTVTVETGEHPDASMPTTLSDVLAYDFVGVEQFQRPIQTCYEEALKNAPGLEGSVTYEALGSHGILKTNVTATGPEALQDCAMEPISNQRLVRTLAGGDLTVGFTLTANFSAE